MRLLVLYGPPASGKLTVAEELARITGFRVFHNHVTRDIVRMFMDPEDARFQSLVNKYRFDIMERAAKERVRGLIFTFVYARGRPDHDFIRSLVRRVEKHGGKVDFVRIHCDEKELMRRVGNGSRERHGKIKTRAKLRYVLGEKDLTKPIPFVDSFDVDTGRVQPKTAALMIKRHYRLQPPSSALAKL
ncbi:MAG: AAA family ATPase [Candidatus Micrarchaeota archaeon]|nr:AAA family ATPase [Candidatus Micrarchaeota archaeon]